MILRGLLIIVILTILPLRSYALSPLYSSRKLYEQSNVSPSPSPSGGSNFQQSCNGASRSCQLKDIAACLTYSQNEIWLFVQNNGKNPLHVKIMILPTNNTIKAIDLPSHQMNKIKISPDIDLNDALTLNSSFGDCVIHAAAAAPEPEIDYSFSYRAYLTPVNGAYVLIILFVAGGALTFVKLRIHSDKLPYHELEMEDSKAISSLEIGTENWDQDWDDDDWGDKKSVISGTQNPVKLERLNGLNTKGRRKEWDD